MADDQVIARYRRWYRQLLQLYSRRYRERFGSGMEQTFHDLCRERADAGESLFDFVLWIFVETSVGIVRENTRLVIMQNTTVYRLALAVAFVPAFLLLWFYGAVAEEGDSPGPIFLGAVAILVISTLIARFRPRGMTYALSATAIAQALIALIEMIAWGQYLELSILNAFFIALWVGSALLFRRAERLGGDVEWSA